MLIKTTTTPWWTYSVLVIRQLRVAKLQPNFAKLSPYILMCLYCLFGGFTAPPHLVLSFFRECVHGSRLEGGEFFFRHWAKRHLIFLSFDFFYQLPFVFYLIKISIFCLTFSTFSRCLIFLFLFMYVFKLLISSFIKCYQITAHFRSRIF